MNILHIGSNSIHVSSYMDALKHEGLRQFLVSEVACGFESAERELNLSFKSIEPFSLIHSMRQLKAFMHGVSPDVVHIHQVNRLAYFAARQAKKLGIPVITTAWGSDVLVMPRQNALYRHVVRSVLRNSRFVTADSREMIDAMERIVKKGAAYIKVQYGIEPVNPGVKEQIVYSNRLLKPFYRVDQVIRYFADFQEAHPGWKLVVGGSGTEEEKLRNLCASLGIADKVEFIGFVNVTANRSFYQKATIFISIPESDGTSVSLLEAMSAGCIPVVSDLAVSREWIEDGKNGVIENGRENPLEAALKLDAIKVAAQNGEIIGKEATRKASLEVFHQLYAKLLHE